MEEPARTFLIPLRRRWVLWILPVVCLLYFAAVVTLLALDLKVNAIPTDTLVLAGAGLFAFTLLFEFPFFLRRRVRAPKPEPEPEPAQLDLQDEPLEPIAPRVPADDEVRQTPETQQGLRVLEYSRPAKSRNRGAVYAKTYVPVSKEHVLRVETLAAEPRDL